jgi:hypothetical protein
LSEGVVDPCHGLSDLEQHGRVDRVVERGAEVVDVGTERRVARAHGGEEALVGARACAWWGGQTGAAVPPAESACEHPCGRARRAHLLVGAGATADESFLAAVGARHPALRTDVDRVRAALDRPVDAVALLEVGQAVARIDDTLRQG